ncbi:hypothetical protein F7D01_03185 [Erythrobacter sp. 3-20A1M]|uniref:hypothetical protein n=1 Tax=Erythrobacter sp. 3-20A1M TaxID=2653850 RepID=UPI001BFCCAD2|nr:hypothetical protein [Erythrobacter sp. 3-20A1M]QWC56224.1 hypothetical protein F7D01_03185 [Erythrobacter sp. 3-20A1M]
MNQSARIFAVAVAIATLAGCSREGELVVAEGVGVRATRTACPAVGVPQYTGDITTFRTPGSTLASDIDVTATLTDVRSTCDETGEKIYANVTFDVLASRMDTRGARSVELPYFVTVLRGGSAVVSKRMGTVTVQFADGQGRASASAQGGAFIDRAEATLPDDIRAKITRERKAGEADAALDPLADPEVKAALQRANFEVLVGFQLGQDQLAYNATR